MERIFYYFFQIFDWILVILPKLIGVCLVLSLYFLCKYYSLKRITYERSFSSDGVFEGEDVELVEEVTNHSFLPVFRTDIESLIDSNLSLYGLAGQEDASMRSFISRFTVMPFTTLRRTHRVCCLHRGTYRLETAQMIFFKKVFLLPSRTTLHVYPKQLSFPYINRLDSYLSSMEPSRIPLFADAFSFAGVREYIPGDSFRSINHKASARLGGQIYVNQQEYITSRRQMIYLNFETTSDFSTEDYREYMETALSYCVYLLGQAADKGYETGFVANCRFMKDRKFLRYPIDAGRHVSRYKEILQSMSDIHIIRGQSISSLMLMDVAEGLTNAEVLLFTLTMDERCEEALMQLEQMGNQVHVIWLNKV